MIKILSIVISLLILTAYSSTAQYYGLRFSGHEELLDMRTGLDLSQDKPLVVKNEMLLSFDLFLQPTQAANFGYIFRAIYGNNNIDLILSLTEEGSNTLQLVIGKQISKIAFSIPSKILISEWTNLKIKLNPEDRSIFCYVNDTIYKDTLKSWQPGKDFKLFFGANASAHFSTTDVLHMNIKDIKIFDNSKLKYHWPLDQIEGTLARETEQGEDGIVTNPHWLMNLHYNWANVGNIELNNLAEFTFDPENEIIYIISDDSLFLFNPDENKFRSIAYTKPYKVFSSVSFIYDTIQNALVSYSIDEGYKSIFDFEKQSWRQEPFEDLTEYWHHNKVISPGGQLFVFAGYGMHTYKNKVLCYNEIYNRWDTLKVKGNLTPRYLAGGGYNSADSLYYIVGGYGSESGEQVSNPDYYYDIYTYSFKDSTFRKRHVFENLASEFLFANSLHMDEKSNSLYGLIYPKFQFENELQLVKIPLDNPEIIKVGTTIHYNFLDIKSYADLYYSVSSNKLIAVTSYYDNISTKISIYTISFPPQKVLKDFRPAFPGENSVIKLIFVLFIIIMLALGGYFILPGWRKYHRKQAGRIKTIPSFSHPDKIDLHIVKNSSIILFGGFQVVDKDGKDITGQFTPLLKKLFLFILLNSLRNNKGVSSNKLIENFWFDKSAESARNNRAVNIVKLRTLLESVGNADITKETGYWKFEFDPSKTYIDYYEHLQLVTRKKDLSKDQIIHLLNIAERGPFLLNTDADWLDPFKSEVSNDIVDSLLGYIHRNEDDPDFILHLTNCIFYFDIASEEAMRVKCKMLVDLGKHSLARQTFSSFIKEYEVLYGEKYSKSFKDIIL